MSTAGLRAVCGVFKSLLQHVSGYVIGTWITAGLVSVWEASQGIFMGWESSSCTNLTELGLV